VIIAAIAIGVAMEITKRSKMTPDQPKDYEDGLKLGRLARLTFAPIARQKVFCAQNQ